ncbi:MAG TPA: methyltransferase domain-containing protein [Solirubrobacteraceae bacterium]|nr:methyltransferase domain-containing protein [Solirubrobacteraceae bacterium]
MTAGDPDRRSTAFTAASVPENYSMRLGSVVFEPWAEVLLDAVGVTAGDRVLDVASGTGVVARAAARRAGPQGRVVGTDVSEPMLSLAAALPLPDDSAPVEYLEARADNLPFPDESFDVVLCQQGLQFFPERLDAAREMHRVLRRGGTLGAAVWAAAHRLEPFDDYAEALAATGVEPPFPRAFDNGTFAMSDDAGRRLFEDAGFATVEVSVVQQTIAFPDPGSAAEGILGTPFAPVVAALPGDQGERLRADLLRRFQPESAGEPITRTTAAVIVRATKAP